MSWQDDAPTLAGVGMTKRQVKKYIESAGTPAPTQDDPPITKKAVEQVSAMVFDSNATTMSGIELHGGIVRIAQKVKLKKAQVQLIVDELYRIRDRQGEQDS